MATPNRLMIEFLLHYVANEELRCRALSKEVTYMRDWGLDNFQAKDFRYLKKGDIAARISEEIEDLQPGELVKYLDRAFMELGVDVEKIRKIIWEGRAPDPKHLEKLLADGDIEALNVAMSYTQGAAHIRGADRSQVDINQLETLTINGQGFGPDVEVKFIHDDATEIVARNGAMACDIDVHQHLAVCVTLDRTGRWKISAHNPDDTDQGDEIYITAV